jgi:hypothetical protein
MLNWKEVEAELVEAVKLQRRMPRDAFEPSSFATDGPWQHLTRAVRAEAGGMAWMELWRLLQDAAAREHRNVMRTVPLTAEQVTWMEKRIEWLLIVPDRDRRLVWMALWQQACGHETIRWTWIAADLPVEISRKGMYRRYVRALQGLAKALGAGALRSAA